MSAAGGFQIGDVWRRTIVGFDFYSRVERIGGGDAFLRCNDGSSCWTNTHNTDGYTLVERAGRPWQSAAPCSDPGCGAGSYVCPEHARVSASEEPPARCSTPDCAYQAGHGGSCEPCAPPADPVRAAAWALLDAIARGWLPSPVDTEAAALRAALGVRS